jgi:hypothetical protein
MGVSEDVAFICCKPCARSAGEPQLLTSVYMGRAFVRRGLVTLIHRIQEDRLRGKAGRDGQDGIEALEDGGKYKHLRGHKIRACQSTRLV